MSVVNVVKRRVKDVVLGVCLPMVYRMALRKPFGRGKVIFLESKEANIPDSFKVMHDHLSESYAFDLEFVSLGQNRVRLRRYYLNCIAFAKEAASASYIFLNDASDVVSCLPLRPETKVIQLWHGCGAFKKWGMSTAELKFGGTRKDILRHPFYKNLSLVTVSSPEVVWAYAEAMVLEDRKDIIRPLGVSRTDIFFDEAFLQGARDRIEGLVPETVGKRIMLYAPTFRGRVASAEGPDQLDIARFKRAFGDRYVLLIKHHPFVKRLPEIPAGCEDFAFDVSGGIPIDELLSVADVCISDYSSLVFEYSLFVRPMVFFAYDLEDYNDWRGFYYEYDELTPGPVFSDNAAMVDYLLHLDDLFDRSEVERFRDRFMSSCDGRSTERICEAAFGDDLAKFRKPTAHDVLSEAAPTGVDISIVVPAYNAMPELTTMLDSVLRQTYDHARMELIVVDDCSSDGTWEELQDCAAQYPELLVVERLAEPSGSPAKPRNVGLSKARGEYVFFLDADDWLGDRAVEKMLNHAVEWGSDVLLVKMKGENGREVPRSMFTGNQPNVDVFRSKVMWSFAPLKLFKRSTIQDLAFPDYMPEDIPFVLRAYCLASTVSVASDYDYYHVSWHEEDRHVSLSTWDDVDSNLRAYDDILSFVGSFVPEEDRDEVLMRRLFRRDVYRTLLTIAGESEDLAGGHFNRLVSLAAPFYRADVYRTCPVLERCVLDAALLNGIVELRKCAALESVYDEELSFRLDSGRVICDVAMAEGGFSCDVTEAVRFSCALDEICLVGEDRLELKGSAQVNGVPASFVELASINVSLRDDSDGSRRTCVACDVCGLQPSSDRRGSQLCWKCAIPLSELPSIKESVARIHLYLEFELGSCRKEVRLGKKVASLTASHSFLSGQGKVADRTVSPYLTPYDNFSLRIEKRK